jgi:molybdopterin molybdotransferase
LLLGIGRDNEKDLTAKINQAKTADMLITSGGVSMGDYDMVKNVLAKEGEIGFWTVRMKPGKPLAFGTIRGKNKAGKEQDIPHLGLPGNPVSSMVTFEIFVRPSIFKMMGKTHLNKPVIDVVMEDNAKNTDGRRFYTRAIVSRREGKFYAHLTGEQGSGILTSMSLANGLAIVPEDVKKIGPGETIKVMMLDWDEE